jgi:uncharacterized protein (TIGR01777 family)
MQRVLISGGSGFVGRALASALVARGDRVTVLSRDAARARRHFHASVRCAAWTPDREGPWTEELAVVDTVVHLAGEPVARRWSPAVTDRILKSRVDTTRLLVEEIGKAKAGHVGGPSVFVCASATGFYGPRNPDEKLDETSERGQGFLADVVDKWEEAARGAEAHGLRSVQVRIGVVLGEGGGALEKMILPFKLFAGGPVGDGKQVVSWVHRDDLVGMLLLAIDDDRVKGPFNAVSPNAATAAELASAIGAVLGRASWLKAPAFAVKAVMGEAAEILTTGQRVYPARAVALGYEFRHAKLVPALESILGQ